MTTVREGQKYLNKTLQTTVECKLCLEKSTNDRNKAEEEGYSYYDEFFYCQDCTISNDWYCKYCKSVVERQHRIEEHDLNPVYLKSINRTQTKSYATGYNQIVKHSFTEKDLERYKKEEEIIMKSAVCLKLVSKVLPFGAFALQASFCAMEIGHDYYRYKTGAIKWDDFEDLASKKVVSNSVALFTVTAGCKIGIGTGAVAGKLVGGLIGGMFGPAGVVFGMALGSTVGGFLGGAGGGWAGYKCGKTIMDNYFKRHNKTQLKRESGIRDALLYFGFEKSDIMNPKVFNEKNLQKKYISRAKESHPDNKSTGSHEKFLGLNNHMGVLKALLKARNSSNKQDLKHVKQIILELSIKN